MDPKEEPETEPTEVEEEKEREKEEEKKEMPQEIHEERGKEVPEDVVFKAPEVVLKSKDKRRHDLQQQQQDDAEAEERSLPEMPKPLTSLNPQDGIFFLEMLKNGIILENKPLIKSVFTFGRSRECDFPLDHPSVSRFHAVLLFKERVAGNPEDGFFYVVDLNSTHGTFVNKERLRPGDFIKIDVGNNVVRFGGSSRMFMLTSVRGPEDEEEKEKREEEEKQRAKKKKEEEEGCFWGQREDFVDPDLDLDAAEAATPLATILSMLNTPLMGPTPNENVYTGNALKTLQQWFEREGYELEYKVDHQNGKFKCSLGLPVEGQDIIVDGAGQSKKKDSINDACTKACQLLDRAELLFPWQQQNKAKRAKRENSDSDDDLFDETEQTRVKRAKREIKATKETFVETYETLNEKWTQISLELQELKVNLVSMNIINKDVVKAEEENNEDTEDPLEQFMNTIKKQEKKSVSSLESKIEKSKLKLKITELEKEQIRLEKLIKKARPSFQVPEVRDIPKKTEIPIQVKVEDVKESPTIEAANSGDEMHEKARETSSEVEEKLASRSPEAAKKDFVKPITLKAPKAVPKVLGSVPDAFREKEEETGGKAAKSKPGLGVAGTLREEMKTRNKKKEGKSKFLDDEAYVDWVPPVNQSGDGKTNLNDKFGY